MRNLTYWLAGFETPVIGLASVAEFSLDTGQTGAGSGHVIANFGAKFVAAAFYRFRIKFVGT